MVIIEQEQLAKFGYRSEREAEIIKNLTIFWGAAGIYCLRMAIAEFISLKSGDFNAFFSQKSFA